MFCHLNLWMNYADRRLIVACYTTQTTEMIIVRGEGAGLSLVNTSIICFIREKCHLMNCQEWARSFASVSFLISIIVQVLLYSNCFCQKVNDLCIFSRAAWDQMCHNISFSFVFLFVLIDFICRQTTALSKWHNKQGGI